MGREGAEMACVHQTLISYSSQPHPPESNLRQQSRVHHTWVASFRGDKGGRGAPRRPGAIPPETRRRISNADAIVRPSSVSVQLLVPPGTWTSADVDTRTPSPPIQNTAPYPSVGAPLLLKQHFSEEFFFSSVASQPVL